MIILGIETSCDETGIAIYDEKNGLLSNQLYSQSYLHDKYGGVVPELASRNHAKKIVTLIKSALKKSKLSLLDINIIAYTAGPGLVGSLMVGATVGVSLAYSLNIPVIAVHHLEGHLFARMLEDNPPKFPFLALLVSGGNTQLISVKGIGNYHILGESVDDAAGEVFDKIAKLLGLNYPGGPALSKLAKNGILEKYVFPCPMINQPNLNFSFSGLKTYVTNIINSSINNYQNKANIAKAFEVAMIKTLTIKSKKAIDITGFKRLLVTGGVSANRMLQIELINMMKKIGGKVFYSSKEFCTDNGAMIAYVGMLKAKNKKFFFPSNINIFVKPNWSLKEL